MTCALINCADSCNGLMRRIEQSLTKLMEGGGRDAGRHLRGALEVWPALAMHIDKRAPLVPSKEGARLGVGAEGEVRIR